jgi:hypothetical protein
MPKKFEPPILKALDDLYEKHRKKVAPLYPVNKKTGKIELPDDIVADLKFLILVGRVCEYQKIMLMACNDQTSPYSRISTRWLCGRGGTGWLNHPANGEGVDSPLPGERGWG